MLKLFMYLLKPSNERLRKKADGTFNRMHIRIYQSILKWLLKSYRHYAISDTISLDGGRIKIIHEFRDLAFENELKRNGIDVRAKMLSREMSFVQPKGRRTGNFRYFKWKDLKSVYVDDKELFVKHDDSLSVDGNVPGSIKGSSSEDIIIRSVIELKPVKKERQAQTAQDSAYVRSASRKQNARQPSNGLFSGEHIRKRELSHTGNESLPQAKEMKTITKRGFEIDTDF